MAPPNFSGAIGFDECSSMDLRCVMAQVRLTAFIEQAAADAHAAITRDFARLRAAHHLRRLVDASKTYRLPNRFACPECGGPLEVEFDEWSVEDRVPTRGGFRVMCKEDTDAEMRAWELDEFYPQDHRYWQSDWEGVDRDVARWIFRNVEIRGGA